MSNFLSKPVKKFKKHQKSLKANRKGSKSRCSDRGNLTCLFLGYKTASKPPAANMRYSTASTTIPYSPKYGDDDFKQDSQIRKKLLKKSTKNKENLWKVLYPINPLLLCSVPLTNRRYSRSTTNTSNSIPPIE